ncbi:hypothetical protein SAMN05880590_1139 [Rhizobium sp. RU35A]|uniref:hypothetical protein n=1 Tax=Rhizobium sp. RU35A TaxID=1907414 RepID=UPI000956DB26|nr:hypothetical protein [Rhizobium sp. RU35A]SIR16456.1 hypothetical protein SAMN05880590_1139 [Rhizobium sp. RU35A]
MRYLLFPDLASAAAAVALIDDRGRDCYEEAGYTIRADGAVIGKRAGQDDPAGVTLTWDVPRQIPDGRWIISHLENHPMAEHVLEDGQRVIDVVMAGITAPAVDADPAWRPVDQTIPLGS